MAKSEFEVTPQTPDREIAEARAQASETTRAYQRQARSDATWRAYKSDWSRFETWCRRLHLTPLPAEPASVADFIASEAAIGRSPSTIGRRLAAIRAVHARAEHPSPCRHEDVRLAYQGIRRAWQKPVTKKAPLLAEDVKRLVDVCDSSTRQGSRDRALLLLGFAGALRRSELVALKVENLDEQPDGLLVNIRSSKTDQPGLGIVIAVKRESGSPYCPVEATNHWLAIARIDAGALFRGFYRGNKLRPESLSSQSVATIIKNTAERAGIDSNELAGHSLRRGFLTSASRNKAGLFKMAAVSRHRSLQTLREYVDEAEQFEDHAGTGLLSVTTE